MVLINLLIIALLIILTAFFVATEFAIVKVRTSRLEQLRAEGKKNADSAIKVVNHLDEYLSACQLGITVTALGLGWLGEPTVEKIFHPLLASFNLNEAVTELPERESPLLQLWDESEVKSGVSLDTLMN